MSGNNAKKTSPLVAALKMRCPRCREGQMYPAASYSPQFAKMHKNCPKCGLKYEREMGFFWGAMYFSYAIAVAIIITTWAAITLLAGKQPLPIYFGSIFTLLFLSIPLMFRYSRVLMLHLFGNVKYDPTAIEKNIVEP
ncbi:DUF983 domain-containing protein [Hugenholtzia roseola]|uniref:DUF983 domain-containing protein n=1 Tax=Hugenholtzia roseola TaxID=1002 RepID=UPI000479A530|nr:DUF983 domain-containing protein [Hugenholtzia roseola]